MKNGFTLIELLVVVLIIGILAAVALPQYQKAVMKSRLNAQWPVLKSGFEAMRVCELQKGAACTRDELDIELPPPPEIAGYSCGDWQPTASYFYVSCISLDYQQLFSLGIHEAADPACAEHEDPICLKYQGRYCGSTDDFCEKYFGPMDVSQYYGAGQTVYYLDQEAD